MAEAAQATRVAYSRGIERLWDPRVWGTVVGASGATVFVMSNREALAAPWPTVSVAMWAVVMLGYLASVFALPRRFDEMHRVSARAGLIYLASVAGMLLLIRLGSSVLESANMIAVHPAVIVLAVGLHFLPFAIAFHYAMFVPLGIVLAAIGAVGLSLGVLLNEQLAAASAVLGGITMLVIMALDALRGARAAHSPRDQLADEGS